MNRKLDVLIEGKIEELSLSGLPLEFASGLQEIADGYSTDSERLLMMGSLELLLEARRAAPANGGANVRLLQVMSEEGGERPHGALNYNAKSIMKSLLGHDMIPDAIEQQDVESLVERLMTRDQQRRRVGRPTAPSFYVALGLFTKGLSVSEATRGLPIAVQTFHNNKVNFLKRMKQKGIFAEEYAHLVPAESVFIPENLPAQPSEAGQSDGFIEIPELLPVPAAEHSETEAAPEAPETAPETPPHDREAKLGELALTQGSGTEETSAPAADAPAEIIDSLAEDLHETAQEKSDDEPSVAETAPEEDADTEEAMDYAIALRFSEILSLDDGQTSALADLLSLDANTVVDANMARNVSKTIHDALIDKGVKHLRNTPLQRQQIDRVQKFLGIGFGQLQKNTILVAPRSLTQQVIADRDKQGMTESQIIEDLYGGLQVVGDLLEGEASRKKPSGSFEIIEPEKQALAVEPAVVQQPQQKQSRKRELPVYSAEAAESRRQAILADKDRRHADGSLDALDLEQIYGVRAQVVRNEFKRLVRAGKIQARTPVINRTRPGGLQTGHYRPEALRILLPAIETLAREQVRIARDDLSAS